MAALKPFPSNALPSISDHSVIPSLAQITTRAISLAISKPILDGDDSMMWSTTCKGKSPPGIPFRELKRWNEKHSHMFPELPKFNKSRRKTNNSTFHSSIVWLPLKFYIDDLTTAKKIIGVDCADWPLMKFQFACCYALEDLLINDYLFDKVRRKTFKKQLDEHCVYHFWLRVLDNKDEWNRLYRPDRILVDQCLLQVFQFAMTFGYFELVLRLWMGLLKINKKLLDFCAGKRSALVLNTVI
uniref:Uncharacterized protein n=1 Tax=Ditylenchus dipsaci TaxID=166011 RepID=A0A915EFQ1_9BILA